AEGAFLGGLPCIGIIEIPIHQGIEKAKASGVYKGRPVDAELRNRVRELLAAGLGIRAVARHAACSTTTVMKLRDELAQ
ncbi:helix-turn-helix domain-containing protein, partial [Pseudomonas savastanoi]|uniref:helix-turn-helix domain-containing protein n=1 Tax=Pseudomonas savastanoi TaxID=29438 RepID=UPI000F3CE32F